MALDEIYKEVILDHYKNPRNKREMPDAERSCSKNNPLCGDEITVYVHDEDGKVLDVSFIGQGCSISQSSASMMSQAIKGKSVAEVRALVRKFKSMMSIEEASADDGDLSSADVELGDLEALQGVVKFPVRIKCATLAWNTLLDSLHQAAADPSAQRN